MGTSGFSAEDNKTPLGLHVVAGSNSGAGAQPAAVATNMSVELCLVCGDRASGRHYGAISCEGCKGFFKRSIRKQLGYQCRGTMNCEVTKHHRNRCQFCRLQKCLASGMRSDSVQHERKPMLDKKESTGNSSSGSSTSTAAAAAAVLSSGGVNTNSSGKSTSPVYQQRSSKPSLFNQQQSASTSSAAAAAAFSLDNKIGLPIVNPLRDWNLAELTQSLSHMLATQQQQQQLSSQSQSTQSLCYSPDFPKHLDDDDEDSMDNGSTLCLQNLSTTASNNNSQNLNFNVDSLPNPTTAVGLINASLDKRVIDKALLLLAPIQNQLERPASGGGGGTTTTTAAGVNATNACNIKNEIDDDDMVEGPTPEDDIDQMDMDDSVLDQKDFIVNECVFEADLIAASQVAFNLQAPALVSSYLNIHYVCESGSRIVFLSVHWLRKIAAFEHLDERTQIKLLRSAWPGLLATALAQARNLSASTIITTLINNIRQLAAIDKIEPHKIRKLSEHTARLHTFVQQLQALEVSDMEYALLRLAIVFNPHVLMRQKERNVRGYVKRVQLHALAMLRKHIEALKTSEGQQRYDELVMSLMPLSALESDTVEELFFANLVGQVQIDNMIPYILTLSANSGI